MKPGSVCALAFMFSLIFSSGNIDKTWISTNVVKRGIWYTCTLTTIAIKGALFEVGKIISNYLWDISFPKDESTLGKAGSFLEKYLYAKTFVAGAIGGVALSVSENTIYALTGATTVVAGVATPVSMSIGFPTLGVSAVTWGSLLLFYDIYSNFIVKKRFWSDGFFAGMGQALVENIANYLVGNKEAGSEVIEWETVFKGGFLEAVWDIALDGFNLYYSSLTYAAVFGSAFAFVASFVVDKLIFKLIPYIARDISEGKSKSGEKSRSGGRSISGGRSMSGGRSGGGRSGSEDD